MSEEIKHSNWVYNNNINLNTNNINSKSSNNLNINRKFSISKIKDNPRKSVVKVDSKYEFNAPKYFDFSKLNDLDEEDIWRNK